MKKVALSLSLIVVSIFFFIGCHTAKLENGGVYSPGYTILTTNLDSTVSTNFVGSSISDFNFYIADSLFTASYKVLDSVFTFEFNNRKQLWSISPKIKETLDIIRPKADLAVKKYLSAREIYKSNPIPSNLDNLQTILKEIQSLSLSAQASLTIN